MKAFSCATAAAAALLSASLASCSLIGSEDDRGVTAPTGTASQSAEPTDASTDGADDGYQTVTAPSTQISFDVPAKWKVISNDGQGTAIIAETLGVGTDGEAHGRRPGGHRSEAQEEELRGERERRTGGGVLLPAERGDAVRADPDMGGHPGRVLRFRDGPWRRRCHDLLHNRVRHRGAGRLNHCLEQRRRLDDHYGADIRRLPHQGADRHHHLHPVLTPTSRPPPTSFCDSRRPRRRAML